MYGAEQCSRCKFHESTGDGTSACNNEISPYYGFITDHDDGCSRFVIRDYESNLHDFQD